MARLLIAGFGNVLCGDDGLGVVAVHLLASQFEPGPDVSIMEGETTGLGFLDRLRDADHAILVDAVAADAPAGTFIRVEGIEAARRVYAAVSAHHVGLEDLLRVNGALGGRPERALVLGLVPGTIDGGLGCSSPVEACLPRLVGRIVVEAESRGFALRWRAGVAVWPSSSETVAEILGIAG